MRTRFSRYLPEFNSAMLSGLDAGVRPYSVRCRPRVVAGKAIHLDLPQELPIKPGPACLLFHRHDENLWHLLSFALRGDVSREEREWSFHPAQFVPGAGIGGLFSYLRFLVNGRRTTSRYLRKRGMTRPAIPWREWESIFKEVKGEGA